VATLDRPRESTVRQLYALSMNQCAFPDCTTQLVTPDTGTIIGEVCHIRAQNIGGPRYLKDQDDEERHGFDNLILMCRNHHKEIDATANLDIYTVEWLLEIKRVHEDKARESGEVTAPEAVIVALSWSASIYEAGATHMDFRGAVFDLGGKGGGPSGGGGSGGVLTIVGLASVPHEMTVELDGEGGKFPGGGGGGAGAVAFEGRPATEQDVANGLKVLLFFPAESGRVADGLLYVLGGGWEYFWVREFPCHAQFNVAFMVEFGSTDPNVLLGFEFALKDPAGKEISVGTADVEVPEPQGLINRRNQTALIRYDIDAVGVYELSMRSGGACFARYTFEVRLR
jgi:hypothetical protein